MTDNNPCIETVTTKKVAKGRIKGKEWGGSCFVTPRYKGVELMIKNQTFTKDDLKHLIDCLTEIHEVL